MNAEEIILEFERKYYDFIKKYNGLIKPTHAVVSKNIIMCLLNNQKERYFEINLSNYGGDTIRGLPIFIDQAENDTIGWAYFVK